MIVSSDNIKRPHKEKFEILLNRNLVATILGIHNMQRVIYRESCDVVNDRRTFYLI